MPIRPGGQGYGWRRFPYEGSRLAPGPLSAVIKEFEHSTQLKVIAATDDLLAISSPGVSGVYTVEEALKRMLADTGLTYQFNKDGSISLKISTVVTSVDVSGVAPTLSSSMPKYQGEAAQHAADDQRCSSADNAAAGNYDPARCAS